MRKQITISMLVISFIFASIISISSFSLVSQALTNSTNLASSSHSINSGIDDFSQYTSLPSFQIDSNSEFQLYSSQGDGSEQNPYIIEGYYIDSSSTCISIQDTTSNFVIQDCILSPNSGRGITIVNVVNGTIDGCWFTRGGIYLENSHNFTVSNCWIRNNNIRLEECRRCNITSNIIHASDSDELGITLHSLYSGNSEIRIENNIVSGFYRGIWNSRVHYTQILNNYVYRNSGTGIYVWYGSENCEIHYNRIGWTGPSGMEDSSCDFSSNFWSDYDGEGSHPIIMGSDDTPSIWVDNQYPVIDHPVDLAYHWESTGNEISWVVTDANPHSFVIEENGAAITSGIWDSFPITLTLGELDCGNHKFTLIAYDAAGNEATDTVMVNILPDNHGLEWGVNTNQTLTFNLNAFKNIDGTTDQESKTIILELTRFDDLPDHSDYIPFAYGLAYDGSSGNWIDLASYFTGGEIVLAILSPAVPTGNWSLFSELVQDEFSSFSYAVIDIQDIWGISLNYTVGEASIQTYTRWYKSDGSLEEVYLKVVNEGTGYAEVTLTRVQSFADMASYLVIGIGITIPVLIVAIIVRKRKSM